MKIGKLGALFGLSAAAWLLAAVPAMAQNGQGQDNNNQSKIPSAPEFDPAVVGVIAAIVAGGGVVLARRRRR